MTTQLTKIFAGLSNSDIANHCKSGMVTKTVGSLGVTTYHVCAKYYPWDTKPKFYAAQSFYANGSFVDCTSKKLMAEYNKKNSNKIMEFKSVKELEKFIGL